MTAGRKPDKRWKELEKIHGEYFTTAQAREIGLSNAVLSQAVERGQIERVARGSYRFKAVKKKPKRSKQRPPLERLHLKNFSVFGEAEFHFCPGVNVLIGENGTGKSHAMLAAYSILRAFHKARDSAGVSARIQEKLRGTFQPEGGRLGRLVSRARGGKAAEVRVESGTFACEIRFTHKKSDQFELSQSRRRPTGSSIFLPSRELLALYEGFIGAYQQSQLSFSEVYYDTCVALNAPLSRGARSESTKQLLAPLVEALGGKVTQKNSRFYVNQSGVNLEAHLISEGLRKIATIVHLVNNGSLEKNDILFWDEPEANLNPALSKVVVDFLVALAQQGVQIILATHDFAMTTRLSIMAEHEIVTPDLVRFFSLTRASGPTSEVEVAHASDLAGLPSNPILDEHNDLYDFELRGGRS